MKSVISAFQKVLSKVEIPLATGSFPEQFALKRFAKKFEVPDRSKAHERRDKTFQTWVEYDQSLSWNPLPEGGWYRARQDLARVLSSFRLGDLEFTPGSSSEPLRNMQSVPRKLITHHWECSAEAADLFVDMAVGDHAFIRAAKIRVRKSLGDERYRNTVGRIYAYRRDPNDVRRYLLYSCLKYREASRFSVVPKNNEVDRSIDLQPFVNMLIQRAIGVGLRRVIKEFYGVDLTVAQGIHRRKIADPQVATIDLKNASDSNTWDLCDFLLPKWFVALLRKATPLYVEGLDGQYYMTKKVSSMGNGFTFELMNLILLAYVRQYDTQALVFGDDIIVANAVADRVVLGLRSAGWVVNDQKSFINSPFRESCGANYHDDHGYIRSYDFVWPEDIGDCIVFWTKCLQLRGIPFFDTLVRLLYRTIPVALRGPCIDKLPSDVVAGLTDRESLTDGFFADLIAKDRPIEPDLASDAEAYEWSAASRHVGFTFAPSVDVSPRSKIAPSRHPLLLFWYLWGGRTSAITLTGLGDWVEVGYIDTGAFSIREKSLVKTREGMSQLSLKGLEYWLYHRLGLVGNR